MTSSVRSNQPSTSSTTTNSFSLSYNSKIIAFSLLFACIFALFISLNSWRNSNGKAVNQAQISLRM